MKTIYAALAMVVAVLLLVGCGGSGTANSPAEPERPEGKRPLTVSLAGWEGAESAGIMMAEKRAYFAELGLETSIYTPATPTRPIEYVVNGTVDVGVSHLPQVVLAKERGAPIVVVGSLISEPTTSLIWLQKANIPSVADLKGKTIAFPGLPFQKRFLELVLARQGVSLEEVKIENGGYDVVSDLVAGRADAIFGPAWNVEGVELQLRGLNPVVIGLGSYDFPPYEELVLVARADRVAREPGLFRDFMAALARGTAAAVENPEGAAGTIVAGVESDPGLTFKETRYQLAETAPLLSETGYTNLSQAGFLVDWMRQEGLIDEELPASSFITNEFTRP